MCVNTISKTEQASFDECSYHNTTIRPPEIILKHLIIQTDPLVVMAKAYKRREKQKSIHQPY